MDEKNLLLSLLPSTGSWLFGWELVGESPSGKKHWRNDETKESRYQETEPGSRQKSPDATITPPPIANDPDTKPMISPNWSSPDQKNGSQPAAKPAKSGASPQAAPKPPPVTPPAAEPGSSGQPAKATSGSPGPRFTEGPLARLKNNLAFINVGGHKVYSAAPRPGKPLTSADHHELAEYHQQKAKQAAEFGTRDIFATHQRLKKAHDIAAAKMAAKEGAKERKPGRIAEATPELRAIRDRVQKAMREPTHPVNRLRNQGRWVNLGKGLPRVYTIAGNMNANNRIAMANLHRQFAEGYKRIGKIELAEAHRRVAKAHDAAVHQFARRQGRQQAQAQHFSLSLEAYAASAEDRQQARELFGEEAESFLHDQPALLSLMG